MAALLKKPQLLSVGTAVPPTSYTQAQVMSLLGIEEPKKQRFFEHQHIKTRHLIFPDAQKSTGLLEEETPLALREKFLKHAPGLVNQALQSALIGTDLEISDIDYLVCVTSTGFIVPGLSALLVEELGFKQNCQRADIVGMGCHGGLNGLNSVSSWSQTNPDKIAVLICCELCSCIYTHDNSENTALVNSLFGDGVSVAILGTKQPSKKLLPTIVGFTSHLIPQSLPHLRFNWDPRNRFSFFVAKETPSFLANAIEKPLEELLEPHHLKKEDIAHWIMHTGGEAILTGIERKLELPNKVLRHTRSVLRDFGNVSSGSFLFSYKRLLEENKICSGDVGVIITMGPGLSIEMALIKW